jgi:putative acetyltransferase
MRTADEHLRKGVGTAILEHIIAEARRRRYSRLSLETGPGPVFEPALTLYRKYGFVDGGAFGEYKQSSFNQFLHLDLNVLRAGRRPPNEYQRMDRRLRQQVLAYDDERAREYEEAYTVGTGTASIPDPEVFKADARALEGGIEIRAERRDDARAVRHINERAFGNSAEARLVDQLRAAGKVVVSLVAADGGRLVGHILFSPVMVASAPAGFRGAGLAPVSVVPESQNQGIGSRLVRAGLEACREARYDIVVVLGHVAYYPRFGFAPARDHGLENEYGAADEFMVLELRKGALKGIDGLVTFAPEFRETGC